MSKIERSALCVHGHFSQPPRGNPIDRQIGVEAEAVPYVNWNDRINQTCYLPNAKIGNFKQISYSFSEGLMQWLEAEAAETYSAVVEADQSAPVYPNGGNALATAYNHVILPLARKRDKMTQIIWGIAVFKRHFGRAPMGFWLPEMAVDLEALKMLAEAGIQYTILAEKQVHDIPLNGGSGPFRVELPGGKSIGVFVRHDALSASLSFNVHNLGGAGHWSRQVLGPARKSSGPLLLLATAGETFGHHYAGEEQFLHWLTTHEAAQTGYKLVTLDEYFVQNPPTKTVTIEERSSWGDQPGMAQWFAGTVEHGRDTTWKGALRRALDNATSDVDRVYEELVRPHHVDCWELRNAYLPALFAGQSVEEFIASQVPGMSQKEQETLKVLLQAQRLTQRMYNSYTFTDNQIDGRQPRYAIACAALALSMAQEATGTDLNDRLPLDLAMMTTPGVEINGADMLREAVKTFKIGAFA